MEKSAKRIELLTIIAGAFLLTAIVLLIVDYQLKNAIIEEAERLRKVIHATGNEGPDTVRTSSNGGRDNSVPWHLVPSGNAGMEASRIVVAGERDEESDEIGSFYTGNAEIPGTDNDVGA